MSSHSKVHPEPLMDGNDSPQPFLTVDDGDTDDEKVDTSILSAVDRRVSRSKISERVCRGFSSFPATWAQRFRIDRRKRRFVRH